MSLNDIVSLSALELQARIEHQRHFEAESKLRDIGTRSNEVAPAHTTHEANCSSPARCYSNALLLLAIAGLLIACGGGGSSTATTQAQAGDTTAPLSPRGLVARAVAASQINLSWTAATDNVGVTGYNVYRGGIQIATLGAVTTFQDTGLAASTTYSYTVRAFDAAGNVSAPSSSASDLTLPPGLDTTAPSTPTGLTATAASSSQVNLSWTAATDNVGVAGYNVYRGGIQIATLGAVTAYQNTGLAASTYSYAVEAFDAAGNVSVRTMAASVTVGAIALLAWDAVTAADFSGYRIYYGTAPGTYTQSFGQGVNVGNVLTYTVTGLGSGTRYYFAATAYDTMGNESGYSNEVFKDIP
jgi:chitodextrinase